MQTNNYFDVYYQPGENPVFCYRSGLMVYEEALIGGALVAQGWNAAGYPLNVLTNCPTRLDPTKFGEPYAFNLTVNGICVDYALEFENFVTEKDDKHLHACLMLKSTLAPIEIHIHTTLDGTQMFTRWLTLVNCSDAPLNVSRISLISGGLEVMDRAPLTYSNAIDTFYSVGYFDETEVCREGDFSWHPLTPDTTSIDTRYNRNRFRYPLVFIRNNVTGTMWFSQIGWSAGCRFTLDYNAQKERTTSTLAFKAEITGVAPILVLRPDEAYITPEVHMGVVQGSLDDAINEMHTHTRRSVLNRPEADPAECLVGCGMGAEHDMSVETSKAFIDQFAEMGGEIFIIDAGWQNPPHREMEWQPFNGINRPNPDRYPNGLTELSDYCHEKGLKFALWVEIERIGKYSGVYEEHPEWRLKNTLNQQSINFLDLTNPEAAAWAESELARIITEYKLDMLRVDYNVDHRDYFAVKNNGFGQECVSMRHFDAVYKMYSNLKKRFPHVVFENCASGGARTDLGIMKSFNHTWVSDWQNLPRSAMITSGLTMALPPERVDRLFAGMGCHAFGSFDAQMRNTMLTHMSLNIVAPAATYANPLQMDFVRRSVQLYKDFIRPILPASKVYHHTPDVKEALNSGATILEIAAPDHTRGIIGVFATTKCGEQEIHVIPRGIDPAKMYRITLDNTQSTFEMPGSALYQNGIRSALPAALTSELVLYQAIS